MRTPAYERGAHVRGACYAVAGSGVPLAELQALDPSTCVRIDVGAGRGGLRQARLGGQPAFVREYRRGGILAALLPGVRISARRLTDELALSTALEERGLACPRALGGWALRRGFGYELFLATAAVVDGEDLIFALEHGALARATPALRRRRARALGAFVRRLHDAGLRHPDLQPRNLMLRGDAALVLDLDRARLVERLSAAERVRSLARLWRWWEKRPTQRGRPSRVEIACFWIGYARRGERRALLEGARARHARWQWLHRLVWALRSSGAS